MKSYKKISLSRFISKLTDLLWKSKLKYQMCADDYLQKHLYSNPKYAGSKRLNCFEFSAFSQNGEDGIIEEIFRRIGVTNRFFVEFGASDGVETNSSYLLYKGWNGVWIDGSQKNLAAIRQSCANAIAKGQLQAVCSFITAENIEGLFKDANVPTELDFLSVDIDRNDYYVWEALQSYRPRVVAIEYNAVYRPGCDFVIPYDAHAVWDKTSHFGASIDALCRLGAQKGYKLVGCCFAGINAFFVREDLLEDHFEPPFTSENHFEPPRYFLSQAMQTGHPRMVHV